MGSHLVLLINVRCFCPLHLGQYALPLSLVVAIYFNWSTLSQLFALIKPAPDPQFSWAACFELWLGPDLPIQSRDCWTKPVVGKVKTIFSFCNEYMYQGAVLALFNTITNKRLSPRCFVSCGERSLQAHHDVLHHPRVWAPVTTRIVGFKSFINERGQTWRYSQGIQW